MLKLPAPPRAAIPVLFLTTLPVAPTLTHAQAPAQTADAGALTEVVVTARKRNESLQDVPISITAFTAELIEERGIESLYDLAKLTPNLSFNQTYGRAFDRPVIRGQSQILGERTVSFVVDGIYIAGNMSADLDDLEQVEVLKGPQAANYGRGSLAGVISYRTRKPSQEWNGRASVTIGDYGNEEASGFISGPLFSDKLSFKLGGRLYDFGGQYTAASSGNTLVQLGQEKTKRVSAALRYEPTENLEFLLRAFASQNKDGLYNNIISKTLNCFTTAPGARGGSFCGELPAIPVNGGVQVDFADIARQGHPGVTQDTNLYSGEMNWDVAPGTLTALVSWNRQDEDWIVDDYLINNPAGSNASQVPSPTMTIANPGNITRLITIREYQSQELRFASKTDGAIDWLVGVYNYTQDTSGFNGGPRYNILSMGVPAASNTGPVGTLREVSQPISPSAVENQAVFASVSYDPSEDWHFTLEGRYAKDKLTADNAVQVGGNCQRILEVEFKSFTPRVTARYDFDRDKNVYVSVSQGNKPGDFNSSLCAAAIPAAEFTRLSSITPLGVKEEKALNYEIGSKMRFFDGRMALDAAIYFIDWTDQQLTTSQVYTNTSGMSANISLTGNAGKTEVTGLELNWRWKINPMWDANLGYGLADAKFTEICDATYAALLGITLATQQAPCIAAPGVATLTADASGFQTANAPKHTVNAGLEFTMPLTADGWRSFFARTDMSYQSERFAEVYNHASTGATTRIDARLGVQGDNWRVAAWIKNLTGERDPDSVVRFFDPDSGFLFTRAYQVHFPNGRTFGVTATVDF